jgi:hypothetical protein
MGELSLSALEWAIIGNGALLLLLFVVLLHMVSFYKCLVNSNTYRFTYVCMNPIFRFVVFEKYSLKQYIAVMILSMDQKDFLQATLAHTHSVHLLLYRHPIKMTLFPHNQFGYLFIIQR